MPEKSAPNAAFAEQRLLRYLRVADAQLAGRDWLAGELSIADFALYPVCAVRKARHRRRRGSRESDALDGRARRAARGVAKGDGHGGVSGGQGERRHAARAAAGPSLAARGRAGGSRRWTR